MARTNNLSNFLTDVADAIRTKKGSQELIAAEDFDTEIENLPSGGAIEEKDVNFYDYDDTLVYSYTAQEFLALEQLPEGPTHDGLTNLGWGWTLSDAKDFVTTFGELDLGTDYTTTDGALKIHITLYDERKSPYVGFAINGTATVDWGDNSTPDTVTGTSTTDYIFTQHNYSSAGDYIISIASEDTIYLSGANSKGPYILSNNETTTAKNRMYISAITEINLSSNVVVGDFAFLACSFLKKITLSGINAIGKYCFASSGLISLSLLNVTSIPDYACQYMQGAKHCLIPNVTKIGAWGLDGLNSVDKIILPKATSQSSSAISTSSAKKYIFVGSNGGTVRNMGKLEEIKTTNNTLSIGSYSWESLARLKQMPILSSVGGSSLTGLNTLLSVKFAPAITAIGGSSLTSCTSLKFADFSECTSVVTLGASSLSYTPDDCKIIVPDDLYEDWLADSSWASFTSKIISKSDWDALQNA